MNAIERMMLAQAMQRDDVRLVARWAEKHLAANPDALSEPGAAQALQLLLLAGINASGTEPTSAQAADRG